MSDTLHYFSRGGVGSALCLPFSLPAMLAEWKRIQAVMVREVAPEFTRDEWAYLATFVDPRHLESVFVQTLGTRSPEPLAASEMLCPRGTVAVWLPNNVSLLGPLVLVLLLLTGNRVLVKAGSRSEDLTTAFLRYLERHLEPGTLRRRLEQVSVRSFGREDARNAELAREANVRIVFGSDSAVSAIDELEHPPGSSSFAFRDRRSETWLDKSSLDDDVLVNLIRVFAIYGRAGCTSPGRVLLLEGTRPEAIALRDRMLSLWSRAVGRKVDAHLASQNVLARQWSAAKGWDAALAPDHGAMVAVGDFDLESPEFHLALPLLATTLESALAALPPNIQTVGHNFDEPRARELLSKVAASRILRFVRLERMHHFGPVWDGSAFWSETFRRVEVSS